MFIYGYSKNKKCLFIFLVEYIMLSYNTIRPGVYDLFA